MKQLFEEYEAGQTPEALLVKDFDKVCSDFHKISWRSLFAILPFCPRTDA